MTRAECFDEGGKCPKVAETGEAMLHHTEAQTCDPVAFDSLIVFIVLRKGSWLLNAFC
jgi:hypothetical protein